MDYFAGDCRWCGKIIGDVWRTQGRNKKYCSAKCRNQFFRDKKKNAESVAIRSATLQRFPEEVKALRANKYISGAQFEYFVEFLRDYPDSKLFRRVLSLAATAARIGYDSE